MASLKDRLDAAGYDTAGMDDGAILQKLDKAGYDTSDLNQTQSVMDKVKGAYQQYKASPVYQASPMGVLNTASDLVHRGADAAGEAVTNAMGGSGIPGVSNPNVAAGVGTALQMAPDIAMAATGSGLAQDAAKAGELGMAGRVASGPARAVAGQAIGAAQDAAGLDSTVVPSLNRMTRALGLPKGQATAKDYITALQGVVNKGELTPQDLLDHHKMLTDLLADEPTGFAKMISTRPSRLGNSGVAQAAKTDAAIVQQLNEAAPGRADAAANYSAAMLRNKGYKAAGGAGLAAITGSNLTNVLKKVFGGQ
jgi:hypothetical protein